MMAASVQSPEKELRFTRSRQAVIFWLLAAIFTSVALTLWATSFYREINPELPHPAWALAAVVPALLALRLAIRLTRHAYLILTPIGLEIFPFFRPAQTMQLVMWQELAGAEVDQQESTLTLHYNSEKTSGIRLSLKPIRRDRRKLLTKGVIGRVSNPRVQ